MFTTTCTRLFALRFARLGIVASSVLSATCSATYAQVSPEDQMRAELLELKERVAKLESELVRSAASKETLDRKIDQIIATSEAGSLFPASSGRAGWDNGFFIESLDKNYRIVPYAQLQFRYVFNSAVEPFQTSGDTVDGFELRRARFGVRGNVISPDLTYNLRLAVNRNGGNVQLEEFTARLQVSPEVAFRFGQWEAGVNREQALLSTRQVAVERSMFNDLLGGGVTGFQQGVTLQYQSTSKITRFDLSLTDGDRSANTDFTNINADVGLQGRFDHVITGDPSGLDDLTALDQKDFFLSTGGGFAYSISGDLQTLRYSLDASMKSQSGIAVLISSIAESRLGSQDALSVGALGQVAYVIPGTRMETFGRGAWTVLDSVPEAAQNNFSEVTFGLTHYFKRHAAKFTFDATYLFNGAPSGVGVGGSGARAVEDQQVILRGQFQLLF